MKNIPVYKLFAIRYAKRDAVRNDNFIGGDSKDEAMPLDYFIWLAKSPEHTVVIDCGFMPESALGKRSFLRSPLDLLAAMGIDPNSVQDVILTHLHSDHTGYTDSFRMANFHLQESEMHYATGRHMRYEYFRSAFKLEDILSIVRLNYAGRLRFYEGAAEPFPGLTLHPVGGHSAGLQFVRVHTARGWVILASDVAHFYENMEAQRPFPAAFHIGEMLEGFQRLYELAPTPDHIVPGHDPKVMKRYPPVNGLEGFVVRLDAPPYPLDGG